MPKALGWCFALACLGVYVIIIGYAVVVNP